VLKYEGTVDINSGVLKLTRYVKRMTRVARKEKKGMEKQQKKVHIVQYFEGKSVCQ